MTDRPNQLTRRKFLQSAATIAGGAMLAPSATWLITGRRPTELPESVRPSRAKKPNVLLIVMDTARADRLSAYGYHRPTTPHLAEFAAQSRLYTNALSPSPWTLPAHASLFTGLPTSAHGATWTHTRLDEKFTTLASHLQASGYQTAGLSCNNAWVTPECGMDRGFEFFWNARSDPDVLPLHEQLARWLSGDRRRHEDAYAASGMHRQLGKWFSRDYDPDRPFFVFMNYIEPHDPYEPPIERLKWASRDLADKWHGKQDRDIMYRHMLTGADFLSGEDIDELSLLYDEEIAFLDRKIGELLAFLTANGLDDSTLVIVTSDHGEHFNEHHLLVHHYSLYEPLVRVPLIARFPGRLPAGRDDSLVQSHDAYPTILQAAEIDWSPQPVHTCRSLLDAPPAEPRWAVSEYLAPYVIGIAQTAAVYTHPDYSRFLRKLRAIQTGRTKLIRSSDGDAVLYDLASDPGENRNIADERPQTANDLSGKLDTWLASFDHYEAPVLTDDQLKTLTPQQLKALRSLGYVK